MRMDIFSFVCVTQKKHIPLMLLVIFFSQTFLSFSQTVRTVGLGGNYTTLRSAFSAINSGTITGNIELQIISSITDNNTAIINASGSGGANYTSVSVYPTVSNYTLSGTYNGALIDLNGADNVTIDGRVNRIGAVKDLTIANTNLGVGVSTILFRESAQNNTIRYCTIKGKAPNTTSGTIFFSVAGSGSGNDNNTIEYCNITDRAANGIFSLGTASRENSGLNISNNNIYDTFLGNTNSFSVWLYANTTDCTISGNSFYETTTIVPVAGADFYQFIRIMNQNGSGVDVGNIGNNFIVTNNYIGGTAPLCGGTSLQIATTVTYSVRVAALRLMLGVTTASSVQGNIIKNISVKSSNANLFYGIFIDKGVVNVGNISGNVIGSDTGTGSIQIASTANSNTYGIYISSISATVISNNLLGSITTTSSAPNISHGVYGIYKSAVAGNFTAYNNTIGSSTQANSINASSAATGSDQLVCGIYTRGTGTTTINNNTIVNITNSSTRNSATCGTFGINYGGPTSGANQIYRNYIYNLGFSGTSPISVITGIDVASGFGNFFNNVINIGKNVTSTPSVRGVSVESTTNNNNIYHNSIYVSGTTSGTTGNTYGIYRSSASGNIFIRNNIFMNARSGGATGYHYAVGITNTTGVTINYNDYFINGTIYLGSINGANTNAYTTWGGANSKNVNPNFLIPGGSDPKNYILRKNLPGTNVSILDDYARSTIRSTTAPTMGAWERINNYWKGATNTDWGTASNWTDNQVPYNYEDVEIATISNFGSVAVNNLILDTDRIVGTLKNYSSVAIVIPAVAGGVSLTIDDTIKTSGNPELIRIKSSSTNPNGSLIFNKPALNTTVKATVEMYSKAYKGGTVSWTDNFDPAQPSVVHTSYYRWQYFGAPVQSVDPSIAFYGSWVREYSEPTNNGTYYYQKWIPLVNTSTVTPFKGYEITQNVAKTIEFQGDLVVGDKALNLTVSGGYGSGYNIFGNSYASAIDISKIQFPGSGVDKTIYLYNTGSFADWGGNRAINGSSPGSYYAIPYNAAPILGNEIPSMQGFLLIATTNNSTVTIPYNATTNSLTKNTTMQRVKSINKSNMEDEEDVAKLVDNGLSYLKVDVIGENSFDRAWIFCEEGTSHEFDNGWDGRKLNSVKGMCIYSDENIGSLQVNTVNEIDSVCLGFQAGNDTIYNLEIVKNSNLTKKYPTLYLTDLLLGTTIELNTDTANYIFSAKNNTVPDKRFVISKDKKIVDISTPVVTLNKNTLQIYADANSIKIKNNTNDEGVVNLYEITGKIIKTANFYKGDNKIFSTNLIIGTYIVEVCTNNNKRYSHKIIIK